MKPAMSRKGSFTADLRGSLTDLAIALPLAALVFGILTARLHAGVDAAALEMPSMVRDGGVWAYSASQAIGWAALLWSWLTLHLGLALPICRPLRRPRLRAQLEGLHRSMSLTVVGLILVHALLLLWDHMGDTLVTDFIPWTTSYAPGRFPQALGIVSLYLAILLGLSFYVRDRIGPATWRVLHQYLVPDRLRPRPLAHVRLRQRCEGLHDAGRDALDHAGAAGRALPLAGLACLAKPRRRAQRVPAGQRRALRVRRQNATQAFCSTSSTDCWWKRRL